MKNTAATFGHAEIDYQLEAIFRRSIDEFHRLDSELEAAKRRYKGDETSAAIDQMLSVSRHRMQAGVTAIMTAFSWLEQCLYAYAVTFIDPTAYEKHLDRLKIHSRFILIPRLCENKVIPEDCPAITHLNELIKARNAMVHPKRELMVDPTIAINRTDKEMARFDGACRNLENTVSSLLDLLGANYVK